MAVARLDASGESRTTLGTDRHAAADLPTYGDRGHSGHPHAEVTPGFGRVIGSSAWLASRCSRVKRIVSPYVDAALLLGAGVLAGAVGSAGGITSLISFPALLAVGLAPLPANVTQAVAVLASWPGSALGSRPELRGRASFVRRWALLIAVGGAAGVALLLCAPAQVFEYVVPYLLVLASCAMLFQPRVTAWHKRSFPNGGRFLLP